MKLLLKLLSLIVGTLLILAVTAGLYLKFSFDPNVYKTQITAWVKRHTGRDLTIRGPVTLSLFPLPGVHFSDVTLGNAPGFGGGPFLHIGKGDIAVRVLPMLEERRLETRTLSVRGLELNLQTDRRGRSNWQDLKTAASPPPASGGAAAQAAGTAGANIPGVRVEHWLADLAVGGIDVRGARVRWEDRRHGRHIDIKNLYIDTDAILPRRPITMRARADVTADPLGLRGHVDLHGLGLADPAAGVYGVDDLHVMADVSGPPVPVKGGAAGKLRGKLRYEAGKGVVTLSDIDGEVLGATVDGHLEAEQLTASPAVLGALDVGRVNVRKVIDAFRDQPIITEDSDVLGTATAKIGFDLNSLRLNLRYIHLEMDDSIVNGTAEIADPGRPRATFRLYIDTVNLDRYLPPSADDEDAPATPGAVLAAAAGRLPLAALRALNLDGEIGVGALKAGGLHIRDVKLPLQAHGGVLALQPQARLYGGGYRGDIGLDARRDTPRLAFDEHVDAVQLGPFLTDLTGQGVVSGVATVHTRFSCRGGPGRLLSSLDGTAHFDVKDGAVHGLDVPGLIAAAKAGLNGDTPPAPKADPHTDFTSLTGTVVAHNGVLSNDDLAGEAPFMRVSGKGSVNLASRAVDYVSKVTFIDGPSGGGAAEPADLRGVTIPVHIGGTLDKPTLSADVRDYVRARLEGRLDKALRKPTSDPQLNALKGRVRNALDSLFGR